MQPGFRTADEFRRWGDVGHYMSNWAFCNFVYLRLENSVSFLTQHSSLRERTRNNGKAMPSRVTL